MPVTGQDIDRIVALLERHSQRATYGAVAGVLGRNPRSLMQGREKCPRNSWVVSGATHFPTGYASREMHPQLGNNTAVLTSTNDLAAWIRKHS